MMPPIPLTFNSSTIISRYCTRPNLAYYFFDSNDSRKKSAISFLCSCITQLCKGLDYDNLPTSIQKLSSADLARPPSFSDMSILLVALKELLTKLPEVYIVADAVDECSTRREDDHCLSSILNILHSYDHVHVAVTSRYGSNIARHLETLTTTEIAVAGKLHEADIKYYIDQRLKTGRLQEWPDEAKIEISRALTASGGVL